MDGYWDSGRFVLKSTTEERLQKLEAENTRLKAELESANFACEHVSGVTTQQWNTLVVDAERYRWLRELSDSKMEGCWLVRDADGDIVTDLQTAIDDAMVKEKKEWTCFSL